MALKPRLIRTRLGAKLSELMEGETNSEGELRTISGPVLCGRLAQGGFDYLGRYHNQISLLQEDRERGFLSWMGPGWNKFSLKGVFLSKFFRNRPYALGTNLHGSSRAMVPVGSFEKVMPLDILATPLLRTLLTQDMDQGIELGLLELDEEDLALCSFVSPGKIDFGILLRQLLTTVERETQE